MHRSCHPYSRLPDRRTRPHSLVGHHSHPEEGSRLHILFMLSTISLARQGCAYLRRNRPADHHSHHQEDQRTRHQEDHRTRHQEDHRNRHQEDHHSRHQGDHHSRHQGDRFGDLRTLLEVGHTPVGDCTRRRSPGCSRHHSRRSGAGNQHRFGRGHTARWRDGAPVRRPDAWPSRGRGSQALVYHG